MPDYVGPERRQDYVELEAALEKVDHLHGAVTTLANAMSNAVPRGDIEALKDEVKRDFQQKVMINAALSVVIIAILMFFVNSKVNGATAVTRHGHAVIACLLAQPEASRTGTVSATALVTCEQTVRP